MRVFPIVSIFTGLFLLVSALPAQQTAFLNQYTWDPRLFNPARQGGVDGGEIAVAYRNQFQELEPAERPSTYLLHADVSPYFGRRIGIGVQLLGDKLHLLNRLQGSGFFAYHLVLQDQFRLSLGVAASILNQKFNFDGVRVNDVLDLLIFNNQVNATRFDAGPGLTAEYRTRNGSLIGFDVAATQLFSSDIRIERTDGSTGDAVVYDMMPHLLAIARYRYQGSGFAIEPNVAFRAISGARPLTAGIFDINLNAYFLKNNRLMVGTGMRSDQGGYHIHIGVTPGSGVRLIASGEWHAALGISFEVGASYVLGKPAPAPDPVADAVRKALVNATLDMRQMNDDIVTLRSRLITIGTTIDAGAAANSLQLRGATADQCTSLLTQTSLDLEHLKQAVENIDAKRRNAEQLTREAISQGNVVVPGTQSDLAATNDLIKIVTKQLDELTAMQNDLVGKCANLRQVMNEGNCVRAGDTTCLQQLFATKLNALQSVKAVSVQTRLTPSGAIVTYRYPDDDESYGLTPGLQQLAAHLTDQVNGMRQQGVQLEAIELVTELQEDKYTLDYTPGIVYGGEFDNRLPAYTLVDNEGGESAEKTLSIGPNVQITLEGLGLLKLVALRDFLYTRGIPPNAARLQVRYNHSANTYREETKVVLTFRK